MTVLSLIPRQRAAVLEAAREIFARRGFLDVSLGDIAYRARLSPVRMAELFKGKKELFDAVVEPRLARPRAREVTMLTAIFEEGREQGTFEVRDSRAAARALALGFQHVECTLLRVGLPPGALKRLWRSGFSGDGANCQSPWEQHSHSGS
ncbi:TetR/AcrR family transcriptional regulator [Corallococcus exiguus]|uniref:TetR/AcrR family transcriptional regulator n=1 Tax=Corallococcus exiguus TaxID=83462 RepID=UPI003DA4AF4B